MDLLKEITSELRGGDDSANDDARTNGDGGTDDERPDRDGYSESTDPATDTESVALSTTATDDSGAGDDPKSNGETAAGTERNADASDKRDDHLCSFCETEFDADRTVCPECDAEIVVRGAR